MAWPLRLLVLPWSVPIPRVVYLFKCSTLTYPSLWANVMSLSVTSSCRSTNFFPFPGTRQRAAMGTMVFSSVSGIICSATSKFKAFAIVLAML